MNENHELGIFPLFSPYTRNFRSTPVATFFYTSSIIQVYKFRWEHGKNSGGNWYEDKEFGRKTEKKLGMLQVKAPFEGEISTVGSQNSK